MFLSDLFTRDGVECPEWLSNILIENEWINSQYSFKEGIHQWKFENQFKNVLITFDNMEYHFIAFSKNGETLFDNIITEKESINC